MVIDIIFGITLLYGFYLGFSKGIIQTVFTLLSVIFGLMAAFKFGPATAEFLKHVFNNDNPLMFLAGSLLAFVGIMIIIRMFARGMEGLLKTANINVINQFAGGALLAGAMALLFSVLLWFGDQARLVDTKTKQASMTYPYLEEMPGQARLIAERFKPLFKDFWDQSLDMMDRLERISLEREENHNVFDLPDEEGATSDNSN